MKLPSAFTFAVHDPSLPFVRLRPSVSPLSLGKGEWQQLSNIRLADKTLRARFGTTNIGSIVTSSNWRGGIVGKFQGVDTIFIAVYVPLSTKVRVYMSTDASTWDEITREFNLITPGGFDTGIGPYSNTRMSDDGPVWFAFAQDRDIKAVSYPSGAFLQDVLLFGNKSSSPRVYGPFYGGSSPDTSGNFTAIIEAIDAPIEVRDIPVKARLCSNATGMLLADAGVPVFGNTTANFAVANNGISTTNNTVDLTIATSAAADEKAVFRDPTGRLLLGGKQLHIGVETATLTEFLAKVKIEVGNGSGASTTISGEVTVYDPNGNRNGVVVTTLGTNIYLLSFDCEELVAHAATTFTSIRLTFAGHPPAATRTVKFWFAKPGSATAGANPGGTLWATTRKNSGTHTESPGVIYSEYAYPKTLEATSTEIPDAYAQYPIPSSADLFFAFSLPTRNTTQAQLNKGVDSLVIYRKRPDDDDYWMVENYEIGQYSEPLTDHDANPGTPDIPVPTWAFLEGTAESFFRVTGLGREPILQTTFPSAFHVPMPKAMSACGTSDRVFVGVNETTKPNLMFSEMDQPFRYREINDVGPDGEIVPRSAGALNIQGDKILGFTQMSSAVFGTSDDIAISTVFAFGSLSVYATGGKSTAEILRFSDMGIPGTISPGSITVGRNDVFYLDREGQVRTIKRGAISRFKVDSITRNIPASMKPYAWGAYFNERYYLFYTPSGGTRNNRILVWSDEIGDWESVDTPPLTTEAALTWQDPAEQTVKLIAFMQAVGGGGSETLRANNYDGAATTDLGSNITVSGTSNQIHEEIWRSFTIRHVYTVADKVAGGAITYSLTYMVGGSAVSTCTLSATGDFIRRDDSTATNTDPANGESVTIGFSASLTGGKRIYNITLVGEERRRTAERSDA